MPDALALALKYRMADLAVLPLPADSKSPALCWGAWADAPQTEADIRALFGKVGNLNIMGLGGLPSRNLAILDADCAHVRAEVESRFGAMGVKTWVIASNTAGDHRGGCAFSARTPVPVASATITLTSGKLEIRGAGAYALLPPSRHPTGSTYTTIAGSPAEIFELPTLTALDWLPLQAAQPTEHQRRIPRLAWRLLQGDAATVGKYQSRSEAECAAVASLLRAGYAFDEIAQLLIVYPGPGKFAEKYQAKPKTAMDYLRRTFHNAQEYIATHASGAEHQARELRQWAMMRPWPGQTGATDRAVYLAHLAIVERCGQSPHGASARELAELAGVHWHTGQRATHRLIRAGLLTLDIPATASLSARYSLAVPVWEHSVNLPVMEWPTLAQQDDAFRYAGLGKTGVDVWTCAQSCGEAGASIADIATATGRARRTVYRKLARMLKLGMVEPRGDGLWRALPGVDLGAIAQELGTAGAGDAQRAKHQADRRRHKAVLELGRVRRHGR